nr:ycf3-interacting protein 1, chloroplastic [Ipomoea batatas]
MELLKKNRDMVFGEVKLTIMIEDPRDVERKRLLGIDDENAPTREDLAAALEEVGSVIKNPEISALVPTLLMGLTEPNEHTKYSLDIILQDTNRVVTAAKSLPSELAYLPPSRNAVEDQEKKPVAAGSRHLKLLAGCLHASRARCLSINVGEEWEGGGDATPLLTIGKRENVIDVALPSITFINSYRREAATGLQGLRLMLAGD